MGSMSVPYDKQLFELIRTKELLSVAEALIKKGFEVRLVGGVVRDLIQGKLAEDIDLSTNATPDQMKMVFNEFKIRYFETGIKHGTLTAHVNKQDFEVTTLRADIVTNGRHAEVSYVNDWETDAERRDLTINAMSMCIYEGTLYDYFDGYTHLLTKRVQFVGDARIRIREDYLRILRYFRFLGRISTSQDIVELENSLGSANSNPPHQSLPDIIKEEAHGLQNISVERIWSEFKRILIGPNAPMVVRLMYHTNVLKYAGLDHLTAKHLNQFECVYQNIHYILSIMNTESRQNSTNIVIQPCTLLASLITNGQQLESIQDFLKLSNNEKSVLQFIVNYRENNSTIVNNIKKYKDLFVLNYKIKEVELAKSRILQLILYESTFEIYRDLNQWIVPIFPVTGNHIKSKNFKGKDISLMLDKLKKLWIDSDYSLSLDDLLNKI